MHMQYLAKDQGAPKTAAALLFILGGHLWTCLPPPTSLPGSLSPWDPDDRAWVGERAKASSPFQCTPRQLCCSPAMQNGRASDSH